MLRYAVRCSVVTAVVLASAAHAGVMLQPTTATTNMGFFNTYEPFRTIDQSGLAATYTSGVTDFATFASTTGTVNGGSSFTGWYSQGSTTGNFDFGLGGTYTIDGFALWADPQAAPNQGINSFTLLADDNAAFSSPVNLGTFTAVDGIPNATNFGQQFMFPATSASFVRMVINSNYGSTLTTGFVEGAFSQVPAPAGLALVAPGAVFFARRRRA